MSTRATCLPCHASEQDANVPEPEPLMSERAELPISDKYSTSHISVLLECQRRWYQIDCCASEPHSPSETSPPGILASRAEGGGLPCSSSNKGSSAISETRSTGSGTTAEQT